MVEWTGKIAKHMCKMGACLVCSTHLKPRPDYLHSIATEGRGSHKAINSSEME